MFFFLCYTSDDHFYDFLDFRFDLKSLDESFCIDDYQVLTRLFSCASSYVPEDSESNTNSDYTVWTI